VEQNTTANRPYREVLDWLAAQVERLDAHARDLAQMVEDGRLTAPEIEARSRAIVDAHAWLADQLAQALAARGIPLAA
jgi:hypothetical protein